MLHINFAIFKFSSINQFSFKIMEFEYMLTIDANY